MSDQDSDLPTQMRWAADILDTAYKRQHGSSGDGSSGQSNWAKVVRELADKFEQEDTEREQRNAMVKELAHLLAEMMWDQPYERLTPYNQDYCHNKAVIMLDKGWHK